MSDRTGVVTSGGKPVTLTGNEIKEGDKAPDFTVSDNGFQPVSFSSTAGKIRLLSVAPSLDTGICDAQTRRFNEEAAALGEKVVIWTISVDLPTAQKRWCGAAGIENITVLSDHKDLDFGLKYGVAIKENRLLARSIFVIDENDVVRYREIVPEIASHVDYDKALAAVKELL